MNNNKAKTYMIFGILTLVITIIVSSTYAWYVWNTSDDDIISIVTEVGSAKVIFDGGSDIRADLRPVSDKSKGIVKDIIIRSDTTNLTFNLYLDIETLPEGLKHTSFKYALYQGNTEKKLGNFANSNEGETITLLENETINTTNTTYTLYIWIDGNEENPNSMMNQTFSFNLYATGEGAVVKEPVLLTTYITNLYTNAEKTTVTNNEIEYNYATSVSLMNDRLGSSTTDADAGNIRYYGASPNNYIYFNCSDYLNQTSNTCELWRIIGVFDGKVKIMRNTQIGALAWDQDKNIDSSKTTFDNDWSTASLQVLLNEKYYNGDIIGTVTYYSGYDGSTSTTLDLATIGIKNDETRNMISEETYYLRDSGYSYVNTAYINERTGGSVYSGRPTSWNGKIALVYPSDYGYAADLSKCSKALYDYYDSTCTSNNWMKSLIINNSNNYGWVITPSPSFSDKVRGVYSSGFLDYGSHNTYIANGVTPVLHLNADVKVIGLGTESNPYMYVNTR